MFFYDFPAMHWDIFAQQIPFATIRHQTKQAKGCGSRIYRLTMMYKLASTAEKHWRKLRGHELIENFINGIKFKDGGKIKEREQVA